MYYIKLTQRLTFKVLQDLFKNLSMNLIQGLARVHEIYLNYLVFILDQVCTPNTI